MSAGCAVTVCCDGVMWPYLYRRQCASRARSRAARTRRAPPAARSSSLRPTAAARWRPCGSPVGRPPPAAAARRRGPCPAGSAASGPCRRRSTPRRQTRPSRPSACRGTPAGVQIRPVARGGARGSRGSHEPPFCEPPVIKMVTPSWNPPLEMLATGLQMIVAPTGGIYWLQWSCVPKCLQMNAGKCLALF